MKKEVGEIFPFEDLSSTLFLSPWYTCFYYVSASNRKSLPSSHIFIVVRIRVNRMQTSLISLSSLDRTSAHFITNLCSLSSGEIVKSGRVKWMISFGLFPHSLIDSSSKGMNRREGESFPSVEIGNSEKEKRSWEEVVDKEPKDRTTSRYTHNLYEN